jgi:hypothetical protein
MCCLQSEVGLVCAVPKNLACDHVLSNHGKHLNHVVSSSAHHHITCSPGQNVTHVGSSPGQNIMFNLGQNLNNMFSPSSNKLTDVMFSARFVFCVYAKLKCVSCVLFCTDSIQLLIVYSYSNMSRYFVLNENTNNCI